MVVNALMVPPTDFFSCVRGIRQLDPSSPYLFCIATEAFSVMLDLYDFQGDIKLFSTGSPAQLSH